MNTPASSLTFAFAAMSILCIMPFAARGDDSQLHLNLRSRVKAPGSKTYTVEEKKAAWDPKKTALIICDMWDDHWCKGAASRVAELAGPLNEAVKSARAKGVFIIHAPSSVTVFYKDTPQRKLLSSWATFLLAREN